MPCCACSTAGSTSKSSKRHFLMAVISVALAAVALVAIAVPVTDARKAQHQVDAISGNAVQPAATSRAVGGSNGVFEAAAVIQPLPDSTPSCNGVQGLCSVPVRFVTFPGTHNSNAIKNREFIAEAQELGFKEQLEAGARLFDLDYAGGQFGPRFGHCLSCFCSFAGNPADSDPVQVFQVMSDFLTANPRDVIVLGMSNINCGDKAAAREQLLGLLAASPLYSLLATHVVGANTSLGELVDSNQRVVMLFYDQWASAAGYRVGQKDVPNQPLLRVYGGGTTISGSGPEAIDKEVVVELVADINSQFKAEAAAAAAAAAAAIETPWRVVGLFPSTCLSCRHPAQCGPISCAVKTNSEPFIFYQLGKLTAEWLAALGQLELIPAFNGYQVDFFRAAGGNRGLVEAANQLNKGFAWMFTMKAAEAESQGLGNCVWVLDDAAYAGGLVCVHHGLLQLDTLLGLRNNGSTSSTSSSSSSITDALNSVVAATSSISAAVAAASGASSNSSSSPPSTRRLAAAAAADAATAATAAQAVTATTASSGSGRSNRWILLPANGKLQLQLFSGGVLSRRVVGSAGKLTWVDVGSTADALQVLWPPGSKRRRQL